MTRSPSPDSALERLAASNPVPRVDVADAARDRALNAVLEQIVGTAPGHRARRPRRVPRSVALVGAALLLAAGSAAIATGGVPQSVRDALGGGPSGGQETLVDEARMVGSVETQGFDFELWVAPTRDGGSCTYIEVGRQGEKPDGPVECTYPAGERARMPAISADFEDQDPGGEQYPDDVVDRGPEAKPVGKDPYEPLVILGRARQPASVVDVRFGDGSRKRISLRDGYFLAPLGPEGARGAYRLTARDANGTVVARRCIGDACRSARAKGER